MKRIEQTVRVAVPADMAVVMTGAELVVAGGNSAL